MPVARRGHAGLRAVPVIRHRLPFRLQAAPGIVNVVIRENPARGLGDVGVRMEARVEKGERDAPAAQPAVVVEPLGRREDGESIRCVAVARVRLSRLAHAKLRCRGGPAGYVARTRRALKADEARERGRDPGRRHRARIGAHEVELVEHVSHVRLELEVLVEACTPRRDRADRSPAAPAPWDRGGRRPRRRRLAPGRTPYRSPCGSGGSATRAGCRRSAGRPRPSRPARSARPGPPRSPREGPPGPRARAPAGWPRRGCGRRSRRGPRPRSARSGS